LQKVSTGAGNKVCGPLTTVAAEWGAARPLNHRVGGSKIPANVEHGQAQTTGAPPRVRTPQDSALTERLRELREAPPKKCALAGCLVWCWPARQAEKGRRFGAKNRNRRPRLGLSIRKNQVIEARAVTAIFNRPTVD